VTEAIDLRTTTPLRRTLFSLADGLMDRMLASGMISEGVITTMARRPYRRLDCDGRALAFVRVQPKKREIRVEITDQWVISPVSRLRAPAARGIALIARTDQDIIEIAAYLHDTIRRTRGAFTIRAR
jgi:hypothetical protein